MRQASASVHACTLTHEQAEKLKQDLKSGAMESGDANVSKAMVQDKQRLTAICDQVRADA